MSEENSNEHTTSQGREENTRRRKIRDLFTDRVVGIVSGALVPFVLLFVPLINKYLDNSKEIQTLQLTKNAADIQETKQRVTVLTQILATSQEQIQILTQRLSDCEKKGLKTP